MEKTFSQILATYLEDETAAPLAEYGGLVEANCLEHLTSHFQLSVFTIHSHPRKRSYRRGPRVPHCLTPEQTAALTMINGYLLGGGLSLSFTSVQLKKSFRHLMKTHHPDVGGVSENFLSIYTSYQTLMDFCRSIK